MTATRKMISAVRAAVRALSLTSARAAAPAEGTNSQKAALRYCESLLYFI